MEESIKWRHAKEIKTFKNDAITIPGYLRLKVKEHISFTYDPNIVCTGVKCTHGRDDSIMSQHFREVPET